MANLAVISTRTMYPKSGKLLLEMLVSVRPARVVEAPTCFRDRAKGESKFGTSDVLEFVR